jgi:hypothetical protein
MLALKNKGAPQNEAPFIIYHLSFSDAMHHASINRLVMSL